MAEEKMREIENEAQTKWAIKKLVVIHRIGNLKVGETSIIIGVSSEHRHEAFEACKYIINNVKTRVPIWKKEITDESQKWTDGILLEQSNDE
jgi:molybdopterin synthase catalytic subunit